VLARPAARGGQPERVMKPTAPEAPADREERVVSSHQRFSYSAIDSRPAYQWPGGASLAVYVGFNIEGFAFGEGLGAALAAPVPHPDVLNHSWREYGNRVGVWRCFDLFAELGWRVGALINTTLFDQCPEVVAACVERGDEIIAHGHTNAERQGEWPEARERALLAYCRNRIARQTGQVPRGWLSPWISESVVTPDLLAEEGYAYTLNWCHDDQPIPMQTRSGRKLWSIPYPQEINDIPMIMHRQMDANGFAAMIVDHFDETLRQSRKQPLVMGIALHPYIVGQPHRLPHLRRALAHIAGKHERDGVWVTTPGAICDHVAALASPHAQPGGD
jgi:peptidoglycan/xylan/chitin deacetylase (PgdA/CDA1 family)